MENSKRPTEEALNGPTSSCQCLHRREGATQDASTVSEHRADLVQPLGVSLASVRRQLPNYPRRQIDNVNLIA